MSDWTIDQTTRPPREALLQGRRHRVYLHFLNRELLRSLAVELSDDQKIDLILLALVAECSKLCSSIAFIWESRLPSLPAFPLVPNLAQTGELDLISEFASVSEFVSHCQRLYRHDWQRYPMYFGSIADSYLSAAPTLTKEVSTTDALENGIRSYLAGELPPGRNVLTNADLRAIQAAKSSLQTALQVRRGRALTYSLFEDSTITSRHGRPGTCVARLLSLMHLHHYLEFTRGDILTGIFGLQYYDPASRTHPRLDVAFITAILERIGLDPTSLRSNYDTIVGSRQDPIHIAFVETLDQLLFGMRDLQSVGREAEPVGHTLYRWFGNTRYEGFRGGRRLYEIALDRIGLLLLTAEQRVPSFREYRKSWHTMRGERIMGRLLLLIATERERDILTSIIQDEHGHQMRREFIGDHTVYWLGAFGGVEVLAVQSEMGTSSPGAMTLTASDVVRDVDPDYLILTGIAFGLRRREQALGDVLVSSQLRVCDAKKITVEDGEQIVIQRGDTVSPSVRLLDRFRSGALDWDGPTVHFGLMLSANVLVNASGYVAELKAENPDAIGGEMEGAGVYCAGAKSKRDWIVVKGICDWGSRKQDRYQSLAASNAINYVLHVLQAGGLRQ